MAGNNQIYYDRLCTIKKQFLIVLSRAFLYAESESDFCFCVSGKRILLTDINDNGSTNGKQRFLLGESRIGSFLNKKKELQ